MAWIGQQHRGTRRRMDVQDSAHETADVDHDRVDHQSISTTSIEEDDVLGGKDRPPKHRGDDTAPRSRLCEVGSLGELPDRLTKVNQLELASGEFVTKRRLLTRQRRQRGQPRHRLGDGLDEGQWSANEGVDEMSEGLRADRCTDDEEGNPQRRTTQHTNESV